MIAKINESTSKILKERFVKIDNESNLFPFETLDINYTFDHHGSLKT
jgi:hypothetical protein